MRARPRSYPSLPVRPVTPDRSTTLTGYPSGPSAHVLAMKLTNGSHDDYSLWGTVRTEQLLPAANRHELGGCTCTGSDRLGCLWSRTRPIWPRSTGGT